MAFHRIRSITCGWADWVFYGGLWSQSLTRGTLLKLTAIDRFGAGFLCILLPENS